jgi:hypothetical protein
MTGLICYYHSTVYICTHQATTWIVVHAALNIDDGLLGQSNYTKHFWAPFGMKDFFFQFPMFSCENELISVKFIHDFYQINLGSKRKIEAV